MKKEINLLKKNENCKAKIQNQQKKNQQQTRE